MKQFQRVYIEITDYCGLSCAFCPNSTRLKASNDIALLKIDSKNILDAKALYRGVMPIDMFESICAQIYNKTRRVCLHLLGDPLSVRNLNEYIAILDGYKLQVDLVTTGLFLRKSHFDMLISPPFVQVSFSLSAFFANKSKLNKTHLIRILEFCRYKVSRNSTIFINLRLHSNDISQNSNAFKDMLREISVFFGIKPNQIESILPNGKVRLANKVLLVPKQSFEWKLNNYSIDRNEVVKREHSKHGVRFCHGAHEQIGILSNGNVVPCCIDYDGNASFGCIKDISLNEILNSSKFIEFKNKLELGMPASKLCQSCGYVKR